MKFITTATGETCRNEIKYLAESLCLQKWNVELLVAADQNIEGVNVKVCDGSSWGGRGLKTGFALLFPEIPDDEPVAWVDTDTIAIGTQPEWMTLPSNSIAGVPGYIVNERLHVPPFFQSIYNATPINDPWLRSHFLQFDSAQTARKFCEEWANQFSSFNKPPKSDEPSLWMSCAKLQLNVCSTLGTRNYPIENLYHYFGNEILHR